MNLINRHWPALAFVVISGCSHDTFDVLQEGKRFRPGQATRSDVLATLGEPNTKDRKLQFPGKEMWRYQSGRRDEKGSFEGRALTLLFEGEKLVGVLSFGSYSDGALPTLWKPGPMPLALDLNVGWWQWE